MERKEGNICEVTEKSEDGELWQIRFALYTKSYSRSHDVYLCLLGYSPSLSVNHLTFQNLPVSVGASRIMAESRCEGLWTIGAVLMVAET